MTIELRVPGAAEVERAVGALREWQQEESPFQLHPGDIGWFRRCGAEATAAALRDLGSSSATVCTPSSNVGGVATYVAAGFRPLPERWDLRREA